jgi:hypothetical protein
MLRALFLGSLLLASPLLSRAEAQIKSEPQAAGPPYPGGAEITFQWSYSCPSGKGCSFSCPGAGGANSVTKLNIYLGTAPIGSQSTPAVFYDFSTREIPRANGFSIGAGIGTISCQVNGMTLDYSGPPNSR